MGQGKSSTDDEQVSTLQAHHAKDDVTDILPPNQSSSSGPMRVLRPPQILGFGPGEEERCRILPEPLAATINRSVLNSSSAVHQNVSQWYLLYNSLLHGRSFQMLVQKLVESGPTVIVIKSRDPPRIFGGYCEEPWLTVSLREKQDRSRAAAVQRASREGYETGALSRRPANQSNLFFGSEKCFLFTDTGDSSSEGTVYWSHPTANTNFMYLFDTHPQAEKRGIGMGGQPGYFGWFLDRWLEKGTCHGARCTTFQNPRLTVEEDWLVDCVEAYATHPDAVESLAAMGKGPEDLSSINRPDTEVDKMILELHGVHQFCNRERPEC